MKKVIVEKVREQAKYFCDKHPDRECYTEVRSSCWYGSQFDLLNIKVNMCDECLAAFYAYIKENFRIEPIEDEMALVRHCFCND
jgi:hypothetical protein